MLRLISITCAVGAFIAPAATANASTTSAPANQLSCSFSHGSSDGSASTSCTALTFTLREWVALCRLDPDSPTGVELYSVPSYDILQTNSVYAGNATWGSADAGGTYHALKPNAHQTYSEAVPYFEDDWDNAVDLGPCTE
jgi:hypothetical protein